MHQNELINKPLFDIMPIGVYVIDFEGNFVYANLSLANLLGYKSVSELITHKSSMFFVNPETRIQDKLNSNFEASYTEKLKLKTKYGTLVNVVDRYRRYKGADSRTYFEGCIEVIQNKETDIEEETNDVREIKERFVALYKYSLDAFFLHDFEGNFLDLNPSAVKLIGYNRDEVKSINLSIILDSNGLDKSAKIMDQIKISGVQKETSEFQLTKKDGNKVWVETFSIAIYKDGKPYAVQGIARDISKKKEAEQSLIQSEQEYYKLLENIPDPVIIHQKGILVYINSKVEQVTGLSAKQIIGKYIFDFIAPEYKEMIASNMYRKLKGDDVPTYEFELLIGERRIPVLLISSLISFKGQVSVLAIIHDISSLKETEQKIKQSELLQKDIINSLKSCVAVIDKSGLILSSNEKWNKLIAKRGLDINERNLYNLFEDLFRRISLSNKPQTEEIIINGLQSVANGFQDSFISEFDINAIEGQTWYEIGISALSGGNSGFVVSLSDVTDSKISQIEIAESKIKIQTILDNSVQSFVLIDRDLRILAFNNKAQLNTQNVFGKHLHVGDLITNSILLNDFDEFVDMLNSAFQGIESRLEKSFIADDGATLWFVIFFIPVLTGDVITGAVINTIDITERKISEEKMRDYQMMLENQNIELRQLKKAVEQSANSIVITDAKGLITYVNPNCEKVTGYKKDELIGQNVNILNSGEFINTYFDELWSVISRGKVWHGEFLNVTKNGHKYWEQATISPIFDNNGQIVSYISIKEDISKRKEFQKVLESNEAKIKAMLNAIPDLMFLISRQGIYLEAYAPPTLEYQDWNNEDIVGKSVNEILDSYLAKLTIDKIKIVLDNNIVQNFTYSMHIAGELRHYEARMVPYDKESVLTIVRDFTKSYNDELLIKKQTMIKEVLTRWAGEFVNINIKKIDNKINGALADIGKTLEVDRVYLFSYDFTKQIAINTHEWCNEGIKPEIDNLKAVPLVEMQDWVESHTNGKIVIVDDVLSLPENDSVRKILEEQGIRTVMAMPVINEDKCLGFVGFDVCNKVKKWADEELLVLKFLAELIYNLLDRIENYKEKELAVHSISELEKTKVVLSKWASEFINVPSEKADEAINNTLSEIGGVVDIDRIYVFKYDFLNKVAINTHEWVKEGISPQIDNFKVVPLDSMESLIDVHKNGDLVLVQDVDELPFDEPLRQILEPQGTKSALGIPIFNNGNCLGFVGFDSVDRLKEWNEDEIMILQFLADLLYNLEDRISLQNELLRAKIKAEESDKLKSSFLANMSHEIRTPINGIVGFAKLIANKQTSDEERQQYIQIIKSSSNRLNELVKSILDMSKIETGDVEVVNSQVDIINMLRELYLNYEQQARKKDLEYMLIINYPATSLYAITDQIKLFQILSNVVDNAIKFTSKGSVSINFSIEDDFMKFVIKDTGCGISQDFMPYIYDRFRQEDIRYNRNHEGSGIGLSIAKGLCELIDAQIEVESIKDQGSEFTIKIKVNSVTLNNITKMNPETIMVMDWKESVILIAEDDEINYKYIDKLLTRVVGVTTVRAKNGKEAVELALKRTEINLVLMDVKMPIMDGHTATKLIKEQRPELPVIAVTAFAMIQDKTAALKAGCDAYISKPFEADSILGIIDKFLSKNA